MVPLAATGGPDGWRLWQSILESVYGVGRCGDRIRMQGVSEDEGVYIRSMLRAEPMGGLGAGRGDVCAVMEAAGRQTILIETVGVGQDEVEVIGLAE